MADLLIHSMSEFKQLILSCLSAAGARTIVEIGAEYGGMTEVLAAWAWQSGGTLWSIDPAPKPQFLEWVREQPRVRHLAQPSLDALPGIAGADAWLVDGDHNWYTVYHELRFIFDICLRDAKHPLIFLHDVGWPCARRDLYYSPERIPLDARHPHSFTDGVTLDQAALVRCGGFRGAGNFAYAYREGGPRNGVRTAIEDALRDSAGLGRCPGGRLQWRFVPAVFGLGIIYDPAASWAPVVDAILEPWHENELLATLERNRLANYLRVIELQDQQALATK